MSIDPNIKQKADDIRTKVYGSEVRESLASGLEAMSSDVVENEGRQSVVEGRQDSVESQWQTVSDEMTDKDVISAPEIIAARNGESNLKDRLDKENQEVTAQLAQTKDDLEYKINEDVQNLESSINEELNDKTKHRPIHVNDIEPTSGVGADGDLYIQTYAENDIQFYEEGTFTPYITGSSSPDIVEYGVQNGNYVRVGDLVTVFLDIKLSEYTFGGGAGELRIYGLPYSSKTEQYMSFSGYIRGVDMGSTDKFISSIRALPPQGYFTFIQQTMNTVLGGASFPLNAVRSNFSLQTSFTYLATDNPTMPLEKLV